MPPRTAEPHICVEGSLWPSGEVVLALEEFSRRVEARLRKGIIAWDPYRRARVGFGWVGYIHTERADLYLAPKCLDVSDVGRWAEGVTAFLSVCSTLTSRDVVISGPGAFSGSNVLLPWWADYYARVLRRALGALPFLRYEDFAGRLPYLRGRVNWSAQVSEWARCTPRLACRFRRYQADHPLNRLLKWAAVRFSRLGASDATRAMLGACIETFVNIPDIPPEHGLVERIKVPASHWAYREPFMIAKALYESAFPTLSQGRIPNWGFLIDMTRAFESYVDGLVRRAVKRARSYGYDWKCASQDQQLLATAVAGNGGAFYTRPDNVVWTIETLGGKRGIVIDAKYKGIARSPGRYQRPIGSDLYQVIVACVSRGWNRALIIAPTTHVEEATNELEWCVPMPDASRPVNVTMLKVNLTQLVTTGALQEDVQRLVNYIAGALSAGGTLATSDVDHGMNDASGR